MDDYKFKTKPMQHQLEAFERTRDLEFHAILWEQGLGKSKLTVDTAGWLFSRGKIDALFIVAPKSVCRTWVAEQLPQHLPDNIYKQAHVALWTSSPRKAEREQLEGLFRPGRLSLHVLVMNVDALSTEKGRDFLKKFLGAHKALWVIDESTTIKEPSSRRGKTATKFRKLAPYRRILTGTPIARSPLDLYNQFEFLDDDLLGCSSYYGFKNRYCVLQKTWIGGRSFDQVVGYQRLDELHKVVAVHGSRATKAECLDLPDKVYQTRHVELSPRQLEAYTQLRDEAVAELEGLPTVTAPLVLTKLMRLRQVICNHLVDEDGHGVAIDEVDPRTSEVLDILDKVDGKVLIWANFRYAIEGLHGHISKQFGKGSCGMFYGSTSAEDRQALVEAFQDPSSPLRFLVMNPRTGGYGLTLTAAATSIYYDNDWSLEVRLQSEDRNHRVGTKHSVLYVDLVAPGTIDEKILNALEGKQDLSRQVTGDAWKQWFS